MPRYALAPALLLGALVAALLASFVVPVPAQAHPAPLDLPALLSFFRGPF